MVERSSKLAELISGHRVKEGGGVEGRIGFPSTGTGRHFFASCYAGLMEGV